LAPNLPIQGELLCKWLIIGIFVKVSAAMALEV